MIPVALATSVIVVQPSSNGGGHAQGLVSFPAHHFRGHFVSGNGGLGSGLRRATAVSHHINCGILVLVWKPGTRGETELEV